MNNLNIPNPLTRASKFQSILDPKKIQSIVLGDKERKMYIKLSDFIAF